jgi:hypothetical protein
MSTKIIPLPRPALQRVAPNYEAMRQAIEVCQQVDEIANLADQAVAAQAYFRQSQDVENEMHASRIRMRAERRLGEILRKMGANGERAAPNGDRNPVSRGDTRTLTDLRIPRDRASRAMQLGDVTRNVSDPTQS